MNGPVCLPIEALSRGESLTGCRTTRCLPCLPLPEEKLFHGRLCNAVLCASGGGMQGRQRVVRHPVGDSPLESASIGRHSRLRQAACRIASPWRLPGESASSGKVFLLGEADSTQCAFRGRQQAVRIVTSLRRWAHFFSPLSGGWHAQVGIQHVSVPLMPLQLAITSRHYAIHCGAWSL